ncbi:YHS domain-containing (seleno)protein [Allomuricauda sp. NBRC 101325]|uniref:YHS domain-containing (seleno)protein n=1 Tax=Allomuricauda sp. NBRC 101325 TaxID=1113758 RepID=UPI002557BA47|nr:YHS domain-containing (seleno)protein [Muricauda sp. NBRC 101325]
MMILILVFGVMGHAQSIDYNTKKGFAANGYDVVAYFDGKALEGKMDLTAVYDEVNYKFSSVDNLKKFKRNPESYLPQYGGYCAYAVAVNGKKVNINPETFEIRDGKLYLFYNQGKNNTLQFWLNESPNNLKDQADKNWEKIKN